MRGKNPNNKRHTREMNGVQQTMNGIFALISTYLDKPVYFDMPNRTLARLIFSEHPESVKSIENARAGIRKLKGLCGRESRESNCGNRKYFVEKNNTDAKFKCPTSFDVGTEPFYLPLQVGKKNAKVLGLFDIHFPFHNEKALSLAINEGLKEGCNVVLLQEAFDFYYQSRFLKSTDKPLFKEQRELFIDFIFELVDYFPKGTRFYYHGGNHEKRWSDWMKTKNPELLGVEYFGISNVFELANAGITYINEGTLVKLGKLNVIHGHEFMRGWGDGGVNPARWLFLKTNDTAICGHFHRTSEHTETMSINKKIKTCWSAGCLCSLSPEWFQYNKWNHGFFTAEAEGNGMFEMFNKRIYNNKVM
jgi:hypothetical protein